jgi:hypothetical protein
MYDLVIYATAAATAFKVLFFPTFAPLAGILLAFSTFAIGFIARPISGVFLSHRRSHRPQGNADHYVVPV